MIDPVIVEVTTAAGADSSPVQFITRASMLQVAAAEAALIELVKRAEISKHPIVCPKL